MKKLLTKLGVILIASTSSMPLIACSFNFYVNHSINGSAKEFANETSSIIKSLVMSKDLNADTISTNDDIINQTKNNTIVNATSGKTLNNWGDLANNWGVNEKIDINGFDPDQFFVASGTGTLTKTINSKKNINNILGYAKEIKTIGLISNGNLNSLINSPILQGPIMTFLTTLQNNLKNSTASMKLVSNLLNYYSNQFLPAITQLLSNVNTGDWNQDHSVPNDVSGLTTFMTNWKDVDNNPYSQWNQNGSWNISSNLGHKVQDWTPEAYSLYRSGILINHLFWQIGNDNPQVERKYLGEIISKNIDGLSINTDQLIKDITPYLNYVLTNPTYLITIIEAVIPIVKKWLLAMPNINSGIKHLIFSDKPSNPSSGSFNLLDVIKTLFQNPKQLANTIKELLGIKENSFDTFTYDIIVKISDVQQPLGVLLKIIPETYINPLIDKITTMLNSSTIITTLDTIFNLIANVSQQYHGDEMIDINLTKLTQFLTDKNSGLLVILQTTIETLKQIVDPNHNINPNDISKLFYALGCQPDSTKGFKPNSPINVLQKEINDTTSPLSNLINIIIDNNDKKGLATIITKQNDDWIKEHYTKYLSEKTKKTNNITNIVINEKTDDNIQTINLSYDFIYTDNNTTYHFVVSLIDTESLSTFQGMRNFKFKSITLLN
ncbi:hypothetical protein [Spiroplasma endosymbiont of Virgichneumon dumeticola]|uniref:hypothetical protein n=1 Tax=Spiroplasma endosymbiont of Virgichneumon dumeticola TaxID=3139323 RepID=UPI0035C8BEE7